MYAKQLREQLARLSHDMSGIVNAAKTQNNRGLTTEEAEKFDRLEAEYSGLEKSIERAEKSEKIENGLRIVEASKVATTSAPAKGTVSEEQKELHTTAFTNYLRGGIEGLGSDERVLMASKMSISNTMSTGTGSQGGYLVPQGFSGQLEEALKWYGGMLDAGTVFETETGNPLPWPTMNDTGNVGRILGQNVQVTNTDLSFGQVTFNNYIFTSDICLVPLALLQDSYFDINAEVAKMLGIRLGRLLNNKLTVGSGTGEPNGMQTLVAAGTTGITGATGQTTSIISDNLIDVQHKVDPAYRDNGKYMLHDSTLAIIKKLKDSQNRPLWQPFGMSSIGGGFAPLIFDKPYIINNDMPTMAANAKSLLFGDFTKYKIRKVAGGTTVLRLVERYADYLQVGFVAFARYDGQLMDAGTHPVAFYANSAT